MITDYSSEGKIFKLVPLVDHESHDIYIGFTWSYSLSKTMTIIKSMLIKPLKHL